MSLQADVIGGFPQVSPNCAGCGQPLRIENAWVTDGCPCNTPLGVNNQNETRWRLLMQLQQKQSHEIERLKALLDEIRTDGIGRAAYWNEFFKGRIESALATSTTEQST
jgi:hypothetical protein